MLKGGWLVVVRICVGSSEGMGVLVGAEITFTWTQICPVDDFPRPKRLPVLSSNDHTPLYLLGVMGATKLMDMSIVSSGETSLGMFMESTAPILSPPIKTNL